MKTNNLTKGDLLDLSNAMNDYEQIREKDKQVEITEERILHLSGKVKYTILRNWGKLKSSAEAVETELNDEFRKLGGIMNNNGTGSFIEEEKVTNLRLKYKKDRDKFAAEVSKLQESAKKASESYADFRKKLRSEDSSETLQDIHGLYPTEDDIELIPDKLMSWYMDRLLLHEPEWSASKKEEDEKDKKKK